MSPLAPGWIRLEVDWARLVHVHNAEICLYLKIHAPCLLCTAYKCGRTSAYSYSTCLLDVPFCATQVKETRIHLAPTPSRHLRRARVEIGENQLMPQPEHSSLTRTVSLFQHRGVLFSESPFHGLYSHTKHVPDVLPAKRHCRANGPADESPGRQHLTAEQVSLSLTGICLAASRTDLLLRI